MTIPVKMFKELGELPEIRAPAGVSARFYRGIEDIDRWLTIYHSAFDSTLGTGRKWTDADFHREFLAKPEWHSQAMWLAESESGQTVGTIAATRSPRDDDVVVIRWLAVIPSWQRRGVATYLLHCAELASYDRGQRHAKLETLSSWTAAIAFYRALGYRER